ncbi:DUF1330 domain-containing protein [Paraburkholderia ferrariae]|uniref:DUF1330 domain-containing protein n=1 Tax=Paraburkholderia ferrariae TaxID=386056 RepID=UPI0004851A3A|nr:DUF1330 domain-containing protein [Paraburkholderia ferrariae]
MTAYAVAHLREVEMCPAIVEYLEKIDATLAPYGGRFVIHGGPVEQIEGAFRGDLIVIAFDDRERARQWYRSAAYQAILPLRTQHATGEAFLIDEVPQPHRATDVLASAHDPR